MALVTGSGRGIGRAIALRLASEGAKVVVNGIHQQNCEEVRKKIESNGGTAVSAVGDVSVQESVDKIFAVVTREFETLDILCNNAGITIVKPTVKMTESEWDRVVSVDLKSMFMCSKAASKIMIPRRRGRIISTSSILAFNPQPGSAPYVASKAAIVALTKELAIEWGKYNISVNAIAPGFFKTDMTLARLEEGSIMNDEAMLKRVPMGRFGKLEEIGSLVAFLASDEASYISGQCIAIDGGFLANGSIEATMELS